MIRSVAFLVAMAFVSIALAEEASTKKVEWKKPDAPTMPDSGTPKEKIRAIIKLHDDQFAAYSKARSAAKNREDEEELRKEMPDREKFVNLVFQVVSENPKEDEAVDALVWVIRHGREPIGPKSSDLASAKALALVKKDFLNHEKVASICRSIQHVELNANAEAICREVLAKHADPATRGWAAYALSGMLRQNAEIARTIKKSNDRARANFGKAFGEQLVAKVTENGAPDAMVKEGEGLLEQVIATKEFADAKVPNHDDFTLGELASAKLFRLRNLVPGKQFPELSGTDLRGETLKLSDYRGKVVVVSFWGTWCRPCMLQVPEEKKLVEEFEGRPFVLLGVNCDGDIEKSKKVVARDGINWRSIFDSAPAKRNSAPPLNRFLSHGIHHRSQRSHRRPL